MTSWPRAMIGPRPASKTEFGLPLSRARMRHTAASVTGDARCLMEISARGGSRLNAQSSGRLSWP
jgi:hypothetical protein